MGGLFGGSPVKAPEVPPPPPIPEADEGVSDEARRRMRRKGRKETIITGELVPEDVGKKTLLG